MTAPARDYESIRSRALAHTTHGMRGSTIVSLSAADLRTLVALADEVAEARAEAIRLQRQVEALDGTIDLLVTANRKQADRLGRIIKLAATDL